MPEKPANVVTVPWGGAIRYNGDQVLRVVELLSKFAPSSTHASIAMALAHYLPFANRATHTSSSEPIDPRCTWCWSGLKQDSEHLFNCPLLLAHSNHFSRSLHDTLGSSLGGWGSGRAKKLAPFVSDCDVVRDCLALKAAGRVTDLHLVPLGMDDLFALSPAILRLASAFTVWFPPGTAKARGLPSPRSACTAGAWEYWLREHALRTDLNALMAPDSLNSAPLPNLWGALRDPSLPSPFCATVFEGCPALPPPSDVVWYTAEVAGSAPKWWALPLPLVGAHMRLFEWLPCASPEALTLRQGWWIEAVRSSPQSIIWAVVPAASEYTRLLIVQDLVCLVSDPFPIRLARPLDSNNMWLPRVGGVTQVRVLLILSAFLPPLARLKWFEAFPRLPSLLCHHDGLFNLKPVTAPRPTTVTPAGWWWGTPPWLLPTGAAPSIGSPPSWMRAQCRGGPLCRAVCVERLGATQFSRFFGNLGVPPLRITDELQLSSAALLEGDRSPPDWVSRAWDFTVWLLRRCSRL